MPKALRNHNEYKMQNVPNGGSPARNYSDRGNASPNSRAYLERVEIDNRSIFVGNVPAGVTEFDIKELFGGYGTIDCVSIKDVNSKFDGKLALLFGSHQLTSLKVKSASTLLSSSLDLDLLPTALSLIR